MSVWPAPFDAPAKIETETPAGSETALSESYVGAGEIDYEQPAQRTRRKRQTGHTFIDENDSDTNDETDIKSSASSKRRKGSIVAKQVEAERRASPSGGWSNRSPKKESYVKNIRYEHVKTDTKRRRRTAIKAIRRSWGGDWSSRFPRSLLPRGSNDHIPLPEHKDWSTSLLHLLKDLADMTPENATGAAGNISCKASQRRQHASKHMPVLFADVRAVIAEVQNESQHCQPKRSATPQCREPLHAAGHVNTRTHALEDTNTSPAAGLHTSGQPATASSSPSEDVDRPIKTEGDDSNPSNVAQSLDEPGNEDMALIQANYELAQAEV